MNKTKVVGLSLLLALAFSTNCFAKTEDLKIHRENRTVSIENVEGYKNNIENKITLDGIVYQLKDIKEQENKENLTKDKEYEEHKVIKTSNKYDALNLFEEQRQIEEDGYTGIVKLQNDSLDLKVNDSYVEQYKVTLKKEYNNVLQNELNDIPKTIKENGTIYYLINPVWNIVQTQKIDGQDIPKAYHGIMNYEGIKERRIIKNYIATVTYKGELQKEETESITYHLTYEEVPIEEKDYTMPIVATTTVGVIIFSGIIIFRKKNVYIYVYENYNWRLTKKLYLTKNEKLINVTPLTPSSSRKYKIVLESNLYKYLQNRNITIKYFDKQYIYEVNEKEFEIYV